MVGVGGVGKAGLLGGPVEETEGEGRVGEEVGVDGGGDEGRREKETAGAAGPMWGMPTVVEEEQALVGCLLVGGAPRVARRRRRRSSVGGGEQGLAQLLSSHGCAHGSRGSDENGL